jgi:surface protein
MNSNATSGWGGGMSADRNESSTALIPGITSYATFRYNLLYNNWGEGISLFEADHSVMEGNVSYDNWTINLYLSDATNSLVKGNLVYYSDNPAIPIRNNIKLGIVLGDEVSSVPRSSNNVIIDNLVYNASFSAFAYSEVNNSGLRNVLIANNTVVGGSFYTGDASDGVVNTNSQIINNIFSGTSNSVPSNSGILFSNNNWGNIPAAAKSSTDVVGNPLLAKTGLTTAGNLTADYFKLLPGSPVIDKGVVLPKVTDDYFNTIRDSAPDMGAYEAHTSPNVNATINSAVTNLRAMFYKDTAFNQDISGWDTSAVTDMSLMFKEATVFNQNLGEWDVSSLMTADQMFNDSGMSSVNYDSLLAGWADVNASSGEVGLNSGVAFGAKGVQYTNATDQQYLIDNYGWSFTDGGFVVGVKVGSNFIGDVLNVSAATTAQTVHGLGGNDTITGSVYNDMLVGGAGNDTLTGKAGADTFSYRHTNEGNDVITDFSNVVGGDILDIHYLLDGATQATIDNFITLSSNGVNTQLNIDANGNASGTDVSITLQGISYAAASADPLLFLQTMIINENLVI